MFYVQYLYGMHMSLLWEIQGCIATVLTQAVVGVGVLGLPSALSHLTWAGGLALLTLSAAVSLYTSYLLAALHESPDGKTRHNRRAERPWHFEGPPGRQSQYV